MTEKLINNLPRLEKQNPNPIDDGQLWVRGNNGKLYATKKVLL